jgi:hypothetical protein
MKTSTEIQSEAVALKCKTKIEMENLIHKNIMEEIEAMKKAKIKSFNR